MWVVIGAWILAALVAVVILGFCAVEILTKAKRLRADLGDLQVLNGELAALQRGIADVQARLASASASAGRG